MRIRALVNAELVVEKSDGSEYTAQIGASSYVEAKLIELEKEGENTYADILLLNGDMIRGVNWGPELFENHGVPEQWKVPVPVPEKKVTVVEVLNELGRKGTK